MRHFFVSRGLMDETLIDAMDDARALREDADYRTDFSETGAHRSLQGAKQLLETAERLLESWKAE